LQIDRFGSATAKSLVLESQGHSNTVRLRVPVKNRKNRAPRLIDFSPSGLRFLIMNITDLTQRPPRSPRLKLGGYVILPRMLDKGRAQLAGKVGEYHYACPLDQRFLEFTGLTAEDILGLLRAGKSDGEVLAWVRERAKRSEWEVESWSEYQARRGPLDNESRQHFNEALEKIAPNRDDIGTWFDMLDIDDFVSFGGAA
jgi:hypothetical protein